MSPRRSLLTIKFLAKSTFFVKRKIAFGKRFFEKNSFYVTGFINLK